MNKVHPHTKTYPASIEHKLGMDYIRQAITEQCAGTPAKEMCAQMSFGTDFQAIRTQLEHVSQMKTLLTEDNNLPLAGLPDTRTWMATLRVAGNHIDTQSVHALRHTLRTARDINNIINTPDNHWPALQELTASNPSVTPAIQVIDKVLTENGTIKDNASPLLHDIRKRQLTITGRVNSAMRSVMNRAATAGLIEADTRPALREGRLVLPVSAMNKRKLPGIVHDQSSTGKTYFIEPAEIVELNNEQRELEIEEHKEIVRILTQLADTLRPMLPALTHTLDTLHHMDFIHAKAQYAISINASMPQLKDYPVIQWHDARHPILAQTLPAQNRQVVPMDLDLTADKARILIVSGPNAGGKSVTLKTTGLLQYMIQCGILPTMDPRSHAGIFRSIMVDMGDDQSIQDDLSTYSSHLRNMKYILQNGDNHTLLLIDEFGAGTEPQIGGALAQALLTAFNNNGNWGVITTHFHNLKQLAEQTPGLINGAMVYDRQQMKPTFRLTTGQPGSSFAIDIARRTGLPDEILNEAKRIAGDDYFNLDKYIQNIARDRRYWENKRAEIHRREKQLDDIITQYRENAEKLRQQRNTIIAEAKTQADQIISRSNAAIERTIHQIRQAEANKEQTRDIRTELTRERQRIAAITPTDTPELKRAPRPKKAKPTPTPVTTPPQTGDNVLLDNQGQPGTITAINGDKATVTFGLLKMTVPLARLTTTHRKKTPTVTVTRHTTEHSRERQLTFRTEIDVRGMRADEAIQAVTYYLDDALQFNATRIRILHGTGTGALRTAIRQYLRTVPGITSFHDEDVRLGGAGITVVNLD